MKIKIRIYTLVGGANLRQPCVTRSSAMRLLVGLRGSWKSISVHLEEGCRPAIGGTALRDYHLEPALWFKVRERGQALRRQAAVPAYTLARSHAVALSPLLPFPLPRGCPDDGAGVCVRGLLPASHLLEGG